jgi:hypothetical protein
VAVVAELADQVVTELAEIIVAVAVVELTVKKELRRTVVIKEEREPLAELVVELVVADKLAEPCKVEVLLLTVLAVAVAIGVAVAVAILSLTPWAVAEEVLATTTPE